MRSSATSASVRNGKTVYPCRWNSSSRAPSRKIAGKPPGAGSGAAPAGSATAIAPDGTQAVPGAGWYRAARMAVDQRAPKPFVVRADGQWLTTPVPGVDPNPISFEEGGDPTPISFEDLQALIA